MCNRDGTMKCRCGGAEDGVEVRVTEGRAGMPDQTVWEHRRVCSVADWWWGVMGDEECVGGRTRAAPTCRPESAAAAADAGGGTGARHAWRASYPSC